MSTSFFWRGRTFVNTQQLRFWWFSTIQEKNFDSTSNIQCRQRKPLVLACRNSSTTQGKCFENKPKTKPNKHLSPISITSPWTVVVVLAQQMTSQPVFSIFLCSPLPSGALLTPGLSIFLMMSSHLFLRALTSSPFHCALQDCLQDLGTEFPVGNMVFVWDATARYYTSHTSKQSKELQ